MSDEIKELLGNPKDNTKKTPSRRKTTNSAPKKTGASKAQRNGEKKAGSGRQVMPKRTKRLSNEVKGIMVIALGLFVALCVFTGGQSGVVGAIGGFFKNILMGLFGAAAYVFFIIILFAGINLFIDKKEKTNSYNPWLVMTMFLVASVISELLVYEENAANGLGFLGEIVSIYEYGVEGYGGGVVGGLLCRLLCMLIGGWGAWILNLCTMLVLVIMLTGVSVEKIFKRFAFSVKNNAHTIKENMNVEVEADIDEEELRERTRIRRERTESKRMKRGTRRAEQEQYTAVEMENRERYGPVRREDYFELYFSGKDINELDSIASGKFDKSDIDEYEEGSMGRVKSATSDFDPFGDNDLVRSSAGNEFNGRDDVVEIFSFDMPIDENKSDMEQIAEVAMAVDELENNGDMGDIKVETTKIPRFSFDDLETDLFSDEKSDTDVDLMDATIEETLRSLNHSQIVKIDLDDDFSGDNTGILTEIPEDISGYTNEPINEEGTDFEPPSLVQLEEQLDARVKEARDAGVPMDRAFTAVKNNTVKEAAETANKIENEIKQNAEEIKKIDYQLPTVDILAEVKPASKSVSHMKSELEEKANRLLETLASFKVDAKIINITHGPTVTRFELQPGLGVKVSKITGLADDIALSLAAPGVRIEAPIPGKAAIGIEIPNEKSSPVPIREVIDTDKFREFNSKTAFALGKDISGNCVIADIGKFPHVLIAGATGSGKSVCINSLITSILFKAKPDEVKMIMIDPKKVELSVYNGIPHLLIPVVTDPKHAAGALNWAVAEMDNRYNLLNGNKVRNIQGYNKLMEENGTPESKLPEIVIIIDELADLMMTAKNEVEDAINRLAALARAAGMYLVVATQRPSVDVITGVIKSNVPSRISFAVSSQIDSRTILDAAGAEKLLGKGDMLYSPRGATKPLRIQGNFVSDEEIENLIGFIKSQYEATYDEDIIEHIQRERELVDTKIDIVSDESSSSGTQDETYIKAVELALENGQASVAMLQRKLKIGYQKAARIIDKMEEDRVIGPYEGTKPRQVLITRAEFNEMLLNNME